jgi:GntR family transcriptional regulator
MDVHGRLWTAERDPATELASQFGIPTGRTLLRFTYITTTRHDALSLGIVTSYVALDVDAQHQVDADAGSSSVTGEHQLDSVRRLIDRATDRITARPPSPEEVEVLALQPGTSVLVIRTTALDMHGRVLEVSNEVLAGDRVELVYTTDRASRPSPLRTIGYSPTIRPKSRQVISAIAIDGSV